MSTEHLYRSNLYDIFFFGFSFLNLSLSIFSMLYASLLNKDSFSGPFSVWVRLLSSENVTSRLFENSNNLDVNFLDDSMGIIDCIAAQNFALLKKMALSLFKLIAPILNNSVRTTRKRVGWNVDILLNAFRVLEEDILEEALATAKIK